MKIVFPFITAVLLVPTTLGNENLQIVSGEDQAVDDQHSAVPIVHVSSIFDDGHYQSRGLSSKKRKKEKSNSSKGKIPKGKKTKKYSSDADSNVALAIYDDTQLEILSTRRACTRHSQCKGVGIGDDRSNGCWMGSCSMCLPFKKCYCTSSEGGGISNWNIFVIQSRRRPSRDARIWGIPNLPPGGGQFNRMCRYCRHNLEAGGIIVTGSECDHRITGIQLKNPKDADVFNLFKNFGPPNHNDIGREGNNCHFNNLHRRCKLFCGHHNGDRMHIFYDLPTATGVEDGLDYTDDKYRIWKRATVYGLRRWGSWNDYNAGCAKCGQNLEHYGFIQSGWICRPSKSTPTGSVIRLHTEFRDGTD